MKSWFDIVLYGNTLSAYAIAAGILFLFILLSVSVKRIVIRRLRRLSEKTDSTLDDAVVRQIERSAAPFLYGIGLYLAVHTLSLSEKVTGVFQSVFVIFLTFMAARVMIAVLKYAVGLYLSKRMSEGSSHSIAGITGILSFLVWGVSLVFLLDNLGFKVSTIVAGLGIGGIAVALAAQAILGDLFSYFVIFLDRPFQVGDFIIVDDKIGAVEHIGIKTTRIKSLSGEELVFSNKDLTDSRIHNFKKMERRRVVFSFGVIYGTPTRQLQEIPGMIRGLIESHNDATFDRAHFKEFGNFSLNFEVVYYVTGADYNRYMDIQQSINLQMCDLFSERNIEFAFPTQTVLVQNAA